MAEHIGRRFGNYQLQRLIGHGGFADVYLGEHVYIGTQAAIKLLHTQLGDKEGERFQQEARTVARLEHPNIIRVLEFGIEESIPFLVLSYAPNGTLRDRHPKGTVLPLARVVEYTRQITDALQYAHDEKVIHRDIKPENMLSGRRGEVLLTDFGIALVMQNSRSASIKDLAGTAAYMSPEQIEAHPRPASDQYSLGIVVYEWLSGAYPFQGTFAEIALKHTISPVPPLRQKVPNLPVAVEEVINTALAKDPARRFSSVSAFARALEQASRSVPNPITPFPISSMDSPTILSSPPRILTPPQQPIVQQQISQQPGVQQQIALPGEEYSGGFVNPYPSMEQTVLTPHTPLLGSAPTVPQASLARPGEVYSENLPSQTRVTEIPVQPPRTFLRRSILLSGLGGLAALTGAGAFTIWWTSSHRSSTPTPPPVPTPAPYIYYGHESYVFSVTWSPDGKRIASASNDKTVKVWDAFTGAQPYTYYGHKNTVFGVAWSPDGKRIASVSIDKTAQVWDATPGANPYAYIYRGHTDWVNSIVWSPDGKFIASAGRDKTVQVWDAVTGTALYTYRGHGSAVQTVAWSPDGKLIASAGHDKTVQVWDAATGTAIYTYYGHSDVVFAVAWSPNSVRVASASGDKTVRIWDALTGAHAYIYQGHSAWVQTVAWSPNGKRIASAGGDNTVRVWDATTGSHPYIYRGHTNWIYGVAWSPDNSYVASASFDKTVQVWHTP